MFDILVELLVRTGCFRGVEVAAADDMAVGCVEIEGIRNIVEIAKGKVLRYDTLAEAR